MDKKAYHHKDLKSELIEKGIEIVNDYGLSQLSLRKVAQACNVSHAAPYSHFKNKDEMLAAMQLYITEQFAAKLQEVILICGKQPDFLMEFGKTYISFFVSKPQYFKFLFQQGNIQVDLMIYNEDKESYKPFLIYKKQVLKLLEKTNMSIERKQDWVVALFAYIHGLASLATMRGVHYEFEWENKLEDLISVFSVDFEKTN